MDLQLQGVHVLVTGASGGIGYSTASLYLEQGAVVTAHYNTNEAALTPLLEKYGPTRVRAVQAELSREADVARIFAEQTPGFGPVQILVVNHGYSTSHDVLLSQIELAQWNAIVSANLTSTFLVVRAYMRGLETASDAEREKASVVIIGSTAGKFGSFGNGDYASVKSALMYGFTRTLKNEIVKVAPKGRVNVVAPSWVRTPMAAQSLENPQVIYRSLATMPLKKVAMPEDVAYQIVLVSSSVVSGHVSGQVIMVDGGMEGRLLNNPEDMANY